MNKRIAIINQRYGLEVNGGSELYTRQIAEKLINKYDVEVLTTCSLDYVTWKNHYNEGVENINGVTVRRFSVEHERDPRKFSALDTEMLHNPNVSIEQSNRWTDEMGPYCPKLIRYIEENQDYYDVFIVVTYLYYTAVRSLPKIGHKAIFIPTAHQEPYIHFKMYQNIFNLPKGFVFLTDEEKNLVHDKFNNSHIPYNVMGVGIDVPKFVDSNRFKDKYNLDEYFIYVGRIDQGKDCPRMFDYFLEYKKRNKNNYKLVLMGKAVIDIPNSKDIISLGFVSDEDKFDGIKGAKALILPSKFESLSISVLEAMSLGVPVIVNGICDVLRGHCVKSNGGLYYKNYFEFEGCLNYMINSEQEYYKMGINAKNYVDNNFDWNIIMNKFDKIIENLSGK